MRTTPITALCLALCTAAIGAERTTVGRIAETFKKTQPAVITLRATYSTKATGSERQASQNHLAVIVSPDGLVMFSGAAASLVQKVTDVVAVVDGAEMPATYLGQSRSLAFAKLRPDKARQFPFIEFDPAHKVTVGEEVIAIGSLGAAYNHARTAITSRIAAIIDSPSDLYLFGRRDVQQGSVVLTTKGVAIGVVGLDEQYYRIAMRHPKRATALAALLSNPTVLPASRIVPLVKQPPRSGALDYAKKGWIGAAVEAMAQELAGELGVPNRRGVYISYVVPNSDVAKAGLKQGDVILSWEGEPTRGQNAAERLEFQKLVNATKPGAAVDLEIFRSGKRIKLKTKVEKTPPGFAQAKATSIRELSAIIKPLTYDVRLSYRMDWNAPGVIVSYVAPGGSAGLAGLRRLDVVKEIDGVPAKSPAAVKAGIQRARKAKKKEVVVLIGRQRNTQSALLRIRLGK
jgi:serine protease Do